jgi:hypothetical protein
MVIRPTMIGRIHRHAGALALMVSLALAAPAAAPAAATAPAAAKPPTFSLSTAGTSGAPRLQAVPGQVVGGAVRVRNLSSHPVTVVLQPADIGNAVNGGADFLTTALSQNGRWLHLDATSVHLAPHAAQQVAFTVSIPASTSGASHYAGIVAIDAADLAAAAAAAARRKSTKTTFTISRINRQALPITIRMPGPLTRSVSLRSVKLTVDPVATLMLGLLPAGTVLIQNATIDLKVLRGTRTIFTYKSTLGQLFPDTPLNYRVPWQGTPTTGTYRVVGVFRPKDAAAVNIDTTVNFTAANAATLKRVTPPVAGAPSTGLPIWVWIALGIAAALLIALLVTVYRLSRRPRAAAA